MLPHHHKEAQEVVLFVGTPASGKSSFYGRYFRPHGYVHINQDTLRTKEKCVNSARVAIQGGSSVVIDNTNPSRAVSP